MPASPVTLTSSAKAEGRFGKQDLVYHAADDVYRCPAGERLTYRFTREEDGKMIRGHWRSACSKCPLTAQCTPGGERRNLSLGARGGARGCAGAPRPRSEAMRLRRQTAEHPFGTIKCWMGRTHFLTMTLPKVATEMALNVLAYNMKRVMTIVGVRALMEAARA